VLEINGHLSQRRLGFLQCRAARNKLGKLYFIKETGVKWSEMKLNEHEGCKRD
jgi:hypothetical protein